MEKFPAATMDPLIDESPLNAKATQVRSSSIKTHTAELAALILYCLYDQAIE